MKIYSFIYDTAWNSCVDVLLITFVKLPQTIASVLIFERLSSRNCEISRRHIKGGWGWGRGVKVEGVKIITISLIRYPKGKLYEQIFKMMNLLIIMSPLSIPRLLFSAAGYTNQAGINRVPSGP